MDIKEKEMKDSMLALRGDAFKIEVTDTATLELATSAIQKCKAAKKRVVEFFAPMVKKSKETVDMAKSLRTEIKNKKQKVLDPIEEARGYLDKATGDYWLKQKRIAEAAEAAAREEERKALEAEREAARKALEAETKARLAAEASARAAEEAAKKATNEAREEAKKAQEVANEATRKAVAAAKATVDNSKVIEANLDAMMNKAPEKTVKSADPESKGVTFRSDIAIELPEGGENIRVFCRAVAEGKIPASTIKVNLGPLKEYIKQNKELMGCHYGFKATDKVIPV